ncbi:hypothetical protein LQF12_05650 [Ruania suaedae]|uniref:hypothetical protein n=1 Tax=Ruania suaedae TaxID=2897774 RepID=UPI001E596C43|nr:hypothetical protein [Ruania suaedae]UFU04074.1 hypothetical protein LQF12_05650 [Ruania suaedae]
MTDSDSTTAGQTYVCPHCEATHEHEHVDERTVVDGYRRTLVAVSAARVAIALTAFAALLTGPGGLLLAALLGLLSWAVVTAAGLGAAALDHARRGTPGLRPRMSHRQERRFALVSVLTGAALTPPAVLGASQAADGLVAAGPLALAVAVAVGWFTGSAAAETLGKVRLRSELVADTRAGEVAREAAVRLRDHTHEWQGLVTAAVTAAAVGLEALVCLWLPVLVVVLIPLHVAAAALVGRSQGRRPLPLP